MLHGQVGSTLSTQALLLQECSRAYELLSREAQYRMKQRCIEDKAVRTKPEAFMLAIESITGRKRRQTSPTEGEHILPRL